MRFIGSKTRVLPFIEQVMAEHNIEGGVFCDIFAGTAAVARLAKQKGFTVISNDHLYFSHCLQKTYIELNLIPTFSILLKSLKETQRKY